MLKMKKRLDICIKICENISCEVNGGVAHLGERYNGIVEVVGSSPIVSTTLMSG